MRRKKRRKKVNPVLQEKYDEGYRLGLEHGRQKAVAFFVQKFEDLPSKKGIGPRTMELLRKELGEQYFK